MKIKLFNISHRLLSILLSITVLFSVIVPSMLISAVNDSLVWNGTAADEFAGGKGTEQEPYEISNAKELALLAKTAKEKGSETEGKYYKLTANIVINANVDADSNSKAWYSSYDDKNGFSGVLDGDGHTVSGIYITKERGGLFSFVMAGAQIRNVGIVNSYINTKASAGAIAGQIIKAESKTAVIENCYSDDTVKIISTNSAGGLVGYSNAATNITNCYSLADVSGKSGQTGGIVGNHGSNQLTVTGCYTTNGAMG